ncbi:hypothetical protein Q6300_20760 [Klebsiella pneumoniae]|uniref:hypothetical protein n=1 Tax=Klebsiella pneumoniae TaxID=573 RepID=UPI0027308C33|nr:hypothetical protein [Klebsiella pneumoniae]MDP1281028.1 hypothetical protein [Klebsiella pneumoniae]
MCDKCTAANAEVKKIINEVGAKKLVGMLDSITGHGDAHPLERIMAIVQVMGLFDEPMKILMLARHFGGAYVEEHERANKLQATLDMMSEPKCSPAPDLSGDNISIESKEREIVSLKSSLGMLITAFKLMATHNGFKMPELTGDEHPAAIRQLLGAMADNMDEAKSRIEDMMRELAHRHDLNDQPHKMQQVSH